MKDLFPVILAVLTNKKVIIVAIIVFLYMDFCSFIVRYRKKTKPPKTKNFAAPAPAPAETSDESDEGDAEDSEE